MTSWGVAILALKYRAVRREVRFASRELDLIPLETGMQITPKNVDRFLLHLEGLSSDARESILGQRIHGALEHFRSRKSVPEVQTYLSSHAEIDASNVDSGYTLLRAFIWAIPILGFIGTVLGISSAVSGLAASLETTTVQQETGESNAGAAGPNASTTDARGVADADGDSKPGGDASAGSKMVAAMGLVTQGLATAFDTTFLALVMAILLLFPTESLKRIEYSMLDDIDAFTNRSLLRRMTHPEDELHPELAQLLEPVFRTHQRWLIEWQKQVADLGNTIGQDFEGHFAQIREQVEQIGTASSTQAVEAAQSLSQAFEQMKETMLHLNSARGTATEDLQTTLQTTVQLQDRLAENSASMSLLAEKWDERGPAPNSGLDGLENAIESLTRNVERLAGDSRPNGALDNGSRDQKGLHDQKGSHGQNGSRGLLSSLFHRG